MSIADLFVCWSRNSITGAEESYLCKLHHIVLEITNKISLSCFLRILLK